MVHHTLLEPWQDPRGGAIERVRLDNGQLAIEVLSLGGIIHSLWAADKHGERANLVLGCDNAADYLAQQAHLGAIAGRFANRIAAGQLQFGAEQFQLDVNQASNCLHGGREGFNRKLWSMRLIDDGVSLHLASPDGDMGFPGNCQVELNYRLVENSLYVEFMATTDKPCPVSLTQHSYFNLDGTDSCDDHWLTVHSQQYLQMDATGIPTLTAQVAGSALDLRRAKNVGDARRHPALAATQGFDHCYLLDNAEAELQLAAELSAPASGRILRLYTNQPGIQVYGANFLAGEPGRDGKRLASYQGVCLEPQLIPDSPNQPQLGKAWLLPGEHYRHISRYQFGLLDEEHPAATL